VPAGQRRVSLTKEGCSTCGCHGCSKEDLQLREKDSHREESVEAEDKKSDYDSQSISDIDRLRNGCCRECMKAFSASGKVCII
jgi:hypothetical protein